MGLRYFSSFRRRFHVTTNVLKQFIAALLILNLPPEQTFATLANLLNRALPLSFLVSDPSAIQHTYTLTLSLLATKLPALHDHLVTTLQLHPSQILDPIFQTLFVKGCGADVASRIWDVYVFEGDKVLVRAAVGVLTRLEGRLWGDREEVLAELGWENSGVWRLGGEEVVMRAVREAGKVSGEDGRWMRRSEK